MSVPETAVDKHNGPVSWKDNVRTSGQSRCVKPVSEALSVKGLADLEFRAGVPPPDP